MSPKPTWRLVPEQFAYTEREVMDVKGKGRMRMYYLAEDS